MRHVSLLPSMVGCVLLAGAALAAETSSIEHGRLLYRIHCSNCHGEDGRGQGPLTAELRLPPTDLTRLSDADGEFPEDRIRAAIDGRQEIRGHGARSMPVWGLTFQEEGKVASQEEEVEARLRDLLRYLRSIQRR